MTALLPLFLVSLATVGFETTLTRYFAVAKWSEYGYWVISIVLAGFAPQRRGDGAGARLVRPAWRHCCWPAAGGADRGGGAGAIISSPRNPFNPLQLQNPTTYGPQLLQHRRLLRRVCCRSSSSPACSSACASC